MFVTLSRLGLQLENLLAGALPDAVRRNMRSEILVSLAYGAFYACVVPFIPVVLRRSGASPDLIALYASLQFVGSITTSLSIVLMRRRRTLNVILLCWLVARGIFLLAAFATGPVSLIALSSISWLLEGFVIPGYARVMQKIYPDAVRGKVMSTVRMAQVAAILLITPLAGWALDHTGYQTLFPLASLLGIVSVWFFMRIEVNEDPLPPRQTQTLAELAQILGEDRRFVLYLISFAIFGAGTMLSWPLYPLVQVDRLQLSYSEIGLLGLLESTLWLASYLLWGRFVDQRGGLATMRAVCVVSIIPPLTYMGATAGWMLIPAFLARGIVSGGFELARINGGIQLAPPAKLIEYAALQSTVVGIRGILAPLISASLLRWGVTDSTIFTLSIICIVTGWLLFGFVKAPAPPVKG